MKKPLFASGFCYRRIFLISTQAARCPARAHMAAKAVNFKLVPKVKAMMTAATAAGSTLLPAFSGFIIRARPAWQAIPRQNIKEKKMTFPIVFIKRTFILIFILLD